MKTSQSSNEDGAKVQIGILKRDDFEILSYIPDEMTIDDINEQIQAITDANNFLK